MPVLTDTFSPSSSLTGYIMLVNATTSAKCLLVMVKNGIGSTGNLSLLMVNAGLLPKPGDAADILLLPGQSFARVLAPPNALFFQTVPAGQSVSLEYWVTAQP